MAGSHRGFSRMMPGVDSDTPVTEGPLAELAATVGARVVERFSWAHGRKLLVLLNGATIASAWPPYPQDALAELQRWIASNKP